MEGLGNLLSPFELISRPQKIPNIFLIVLLSSALAFLGETGGYQGRGGRGQCGRPQPARRSSLTVQEQRSQAWGKDGSILTG